MAFAPDGTLHHGQRRCRANCQWSDPRKLDTVYGRSSASATMEPCRPTTRSSANQALPEIFSLGHRDQFGLAPHLATGQMFHLELGPYGGDKVNILKAGGDYGWPDYGYGRNNDSSPMGNPTTPGIEPALLVWLPGIHRGFSSTPATGSRPEEPDGRQRRAGPDQRRDRRRARRLQRQDVETRRETILGELKQRIRDVRQGPDGFIYLLTEEVDGGGSETRARRLSPNAVRFDRARRSYRLAVGAASSGR